MQIRIITCHYAYNYGAVLQTYALCQYLNDNGHSAKVINYRPWYYKGSTSTKNKIKLIARKLIRVPDNLKSEKIFYGFLKEYVPMTQEYKTYQELESADLCADLFFAGSDQIWNYRLPNGHDPAFYLHFVKQGRKASYAASLGADVLIDDQANILKEYLNQFAGISVREQSGMKLLKRIGLKNVQTVLDPVYLLECSKWKSLLQQPKNMCEDEYILVFAFNHQKEIYEYGEALASKYKYKLISVNTFWENCLYHTDRFFWNCKPGEFLYLIDHAACVVTNSFHGLSFSMIFNTPVVLFQKNDVGNSRMNDLLELLRATTVKYNAQNPKIEIPSVDFSQINKRIEEEREKSIAYIQEVLNNENSL